jgi:putative FmdB family regulatory protein
MPRYVYKCTSCEEHFEVSHSIFEEQEWCTSCDSKSLNRIPQMPHIKREISSKGDKVGSEVKRAIEENRALLDEEKKKRVEYKDGN